MNLSEHFTLDELTHTDHRELDNTPNDAELENLKRLAAFLEEVKTVLGGKPIMVNSAFRSKAVNDAVGSKDILASLAKTKSYIDFGIFRPIQYAAIKALSGPQECVKKTVETYKRRRDVFVEGLNSIGWKVKKPKATFYIWARIPLKYDALTSMEFAEFLVNEAGVVVAPGTGFGEYGEGYVRFALVEDEKRLKIACQRIKKVLDMKD